MKVYKAYELIKAIADGEIECCSKFNTYKGIVYYDGFNLRKENEEGQYFTETISDLEFSRLKFELIEDEVDIDKIEEFNISDEYTSAIINEDNIHILFKTQNEIIKAVKQLNNKMKSIKEQI